MPPCPPGWAASFPAAWPSMQGNAGAWRQAPPSVCCSLRCLSMVGRGGRGIALAGRADGGQRAARVRRAGQPMAQPWAVVAGNALSMLVGIGCVHAFGASPWAAALAVGLAIALMFALRCLHPPGGASALLAVLSGVHDPAFVLFPVFTNAVLLVLGGVHLQHPHRSPLSPSAATCGGARGRRHPRRRRLTLHRSRSRRGALSLQPGARRQPRRPARVAARTPKCRPIAAAWARSAART